MRSDQHAGWQPFGMTEQRTVRILNQTAATLTALLIAFTVAISWYSWSVEKDYYVEHLESIAELETKTLDNYFVSLRVSLKGLGEDVIRQGKPLDLDGTYAFIRRYGEMHPDLFNVTLVEPNGAVLMTARTAPRDTHASLAAQDSFKEFLISVEHGQTFAIGRPVMGAVLTKAIVPVRYAVQDSAGTLQYIISASLPQDHLRSYWMDAPIVKKAHIGVIRDDGYLLSSYPVTAGVPLDMIYGQPRTGALIRHLTDNGFPQRGNVQGANTSAGLELLFVYRRFPDFPLTLFVALPMKALQASWWKRVSGNYLALLVLQAGVLFAYRFAVKRQRAWNLEHQHFEEALHQSEEHLRVIIESEPECIKTVDSRGNLIDMNPAGLAMIEADSLEQVKGLPVKDLIAPRYQEAFADLHARVMAGESVKLEFEVIGLKGGRRWLETHAVPLEERGETVQLAVTRDITQRKSMEEQVRQLAFHDSLTDLPNRRLLMDRLGQAMSASKRSGRYAAMIFLDLDHFKPLNDIHGHEAGDLLLREVATRLTHCVREIDTVARFGGDEFIVMLSELSTDKNDSTMQALAIAEKIREALAEPYQLSINHGESRLVSVTHNCTASLGVALFIDHQGNADDILNRADSAMYTAKDDGRNRVHLYQEPSHA